MQLFPAASQPRPLELKLPSRATLEQSPSAKERMRPLIRLSYSTQHVEISSNLHRIAQSDPSWSSAGGGAKRQQWPSPAGVQNHPVRRESGFNPQAVQKSPAMKTASQCSTGRDPRPPVQNRPPGHGESRQKNPPGRERLDLKCRGAGRSVLLRPISSSFLVYLTSMVKICLRSGVRVPMSAKFCFISHSTAKFQILERLSPLQSQPNRIAPSQGW